MKLSSKRFLWLLPMLALGCICVLNLIEATIDGISYLEPFKLLLPSTDRETGRVFYVGAYITFLILTGVYLYLYVWMVSKHITHFWNITILFIIPQIGLCYLFFLLRDVSVFIAFVLFYLFVYQHFKRQGELVMDLLSYKVTGKWISSKRFILLLPLFITVWDIFVVDRVSTLIYISFFDGIKGHFDKGTISIYLIESSLTCMYLYTYLWIVSMFVKRFWRITLLSLIPIVLFRIYRCYETQSINIYATCDTIANYVPFYVFVYLHFKRRGEIGKGKGGKLKIESGKLKVDATPNGEVESKL